MDKGKGFVDELKVPKLKEKKEIDVILGEKKGEKAEAVKLGATKELDVSNITSPTKNHKWIWWAVGIGAFAYFVFGTKIGEKLVRSLK